MCCQYGSGCFKAIHFWHGKIHEDEVVHFLLRGFDGFDLQAPGNHDAIVYDALIADSPLGRLLSFPGATPVDCQPVVGAALGSGGGVEAHFEVKTRSTRALPGDNAGGEEPISVYMTLRKNGPVSDLKGLARVLGELSCRGEELVESQAIPNLLMPIRESIVSGA